MSLSAVEANGTNRVSFNNIATENAATEIFAASTLPTALGAVAVLRSSDKPYVGRSYHIKSKDNTYPVTLAISVQN